MEIKVDAEAVNQVVAEAIIKSVLGAELEKAINKAMREALEGYNSPVRVLVTQHVNDAIRTVLTRDYQGVIVQRVSELMSNEHVEEIVKASVDKAVEYLKRDRY